MEALIPDIMADPQLYIILAVIWVVSAAVEAMPTPVDSSSAGYRWLYQFANTLVGNVQEALKHMPLSGAGKGGNK